MVEGLGSPIEMKLYMHPLPPYEILKWVIIDG